MRIVNIMTTLLIFGLAGCASKEGEGVSDRLAERLTDVRIGEKVDRICFPRRIDGFRMNTRDSVVLRSGVSDDYFVIVRGCPIMDQAQSVGLVGRGTCLRQGDRILVSDLRSSLSGTNSFGRDTCLIDAIYDWDEDAINVKEDADIEAADITEK